MALTDTLNNVPQPPQAGAFSNDDLKKVFGDVSSIASDSGFFDDDENYYEEVEQEQRVTCTQEGDTIVVRIPSAFEPRMYVKKTDSGNQFRVMVNIP